MSDAEKVLSRTSNEGLLKTFAALTHRLHAADRKPDRLELAIRIREDRDIVQAEILRRMQ